jgi:uncharacterized ferritin-like protein (DUF455 family)
MTVLDRGTMNPPVAKDILARDAAALRTMIDDTPDPDNALPSLVDAVATCLGEQCPETKADRVRTLSVQLLRGGLDIAALQRRKRVDAGRPALPRLVPPAKVPRRKLGSARGHAALIHAIAHIEFNAINLALDAVLSFSGLPDEYYRDWMKVAAEEARHYQLLAEHLRSLGHQYGDFDAHDGLWQMAESTAHDPLVRMALVPRVLEARGLDVTPSMSARLAKIGDSRGVEILAIIARDEIGHVAIGTRWFRVFCEERAYAPHETFIRLMERYMRARPKGPLAREARAQAGFTEAELNWLEGQIAGVAP